MRANPRGSIIRTMRLTDRHTDEDGNTFTRSLSAPGIIVRLTHIDGKKPSLVRQDFVRFCRSIGIIPTVCERSEGQFSPRSGKPIPGKEAQPSAYQCVGEPSALAELVESPLVAEWSFALSIRVPVIASGNAEERPRPSMGSAFGKPAQVAATAAALARQGDQTRTLQRKQWAQA